MEKKEHPLAFMRAAGFFIGMATEAKDFVQLCFWKDELANVSD